MTTARRRLLGVAVLRAGPNIIGIAVYCNKRQSVPYCFGDAYGNTYWIFERGVKCQHEMICTGGSIVIILRNLH